MVVDADDVLGEAWWRATGSPKCDPDGNQPAEVKMSSMDVGSEPPAAQGASEGPVLIHVWEILEPGHEGLVLERLDKMLNATTTEPGFVSARVLQTADGHSIAVILEMRTVEDRQRLEQLPWVRETLDHLDETMNIVMRLYQQVHEYHA
jgi:hypothetical protein